MTRSVDGVVQGKAYIGPVAASTADFGVAYSRWE